MRDDYATRTNSAMNYRPLSGHADRELKGKKVVVSGQCYSEAALTASALISDVQIAFFAG